MKLFKISTLILLLALFSTNVIAQEYKMIFWYPGEAGSTADAQASIDLFFDYINKRITPDKITGKYFNNVNEGIAYIKQTKPAFGVLSFAVYTINGKDLGPNSVLLQTLPLPDGKPFETYTVVGKGKRPEMAGWTVFTKQPLTKEFVSRYVLNDKETNPSLKVNIVQNMLPTLKEAAAGTMIGGIILQPMEYHTLKNLNQPWAKELTVWSTSSPVPSAPFIVFGEQPLTAKIKEVLTKMTADPAATEILQTLRFKGFTQATGSTPNQ